jgi:hypothetical protein
MEEILRALGMGTLVERFQAQRVEPETVLAASDNELVRLGATTIGKCIHLREACKKKVEADRPSMSGSAACEERLSIFNPRRHYLNRSLDKCCCSRFGEIGFRKCQQQGFQGKSMDTNVCLHV